MMNGNHLPAGQPMPGGAASGQSMNGGGRGRRPAQNGYAGHHQGFQPHQHQPHAMYSSGYNMNPYAAAYYPSHMAAQMANPYQNGHIPPTPTYNMPQYNPYAQRSPPGHPTYPIVVSSTMQTPSQPQSYARPSQQSPPALSTPLPYVPTILQPPTRAELFPPPRQLSPPSQPSATASDTAVSETSPDPQPKEVPISADPTAHTRPAHRHPLPWFSNKDEPFPSRAPKSRRRRRALKEGSEGVELPPNPVVADDGSASSVDTPSSPKTPTASSAQRQEVQHEDQAPSTSPSTPVSVQAGPSSVTSTSSPKPSKPANRAAVPVLPVLPRPGSKETTVVASPDEKNRPKSSTSDKQETAIPSETPAAGVQAESTAPPAAPPKAAPKSWSALFQRAAPPSTPSAAVHTGSPNPPSTSSHADGHATNGSGPVNSIKSNASSLAEAFRAYNAARSHKIAFLEPRGLINTGNMCYMNSVLQVLMFCPPFYDFLDQVNKKSTHSFKSETPLIDAMVMFMREYKVIDSAVSVDQLRRRLKSEELEQYGEAFTPEFVYDAIRQLPRFASMQRGHQQDAEEFLGFLLESLHDECAHVMRHLNDTSAPTAGNSSIATPTGTSSPTSTTDASDWLEVGRKQRAAVTRSSGHPVDNSPLTKIFGGQLRSELRVSGLKDSVTLEPFQPLQLDIGSPQIRNIVDALKNLTRPETIRGDFSSPRGPDAVATKQVLIESVPPVLILHLKRFQFDATGTGTVKIWKKIGYPLELELPKELFSRQKRNVLNAEGAGFPKYRLMAAVYHHGKNASGGHYTVDLRRQDGREWVRIDDTVIRRIRSEDVAEGGMEEDATKPSWTDKKENNVAPTSGNRFEGIGDANAGDDDGWNKVSTAANGTKKWSAIVNDTASKNSAPAKPKPAKDNSKDNKVAYLLFYMKV
ncbi:cysteine proteinase [Xylariaceae sp. FL1272]|nr:cysteine proteinase [Xylariaceae sp. FL1272]